MSDLEPRSTRLKGATWEILGKSVGAIAVIVISLLATAPAESAETDVHALMVCRLTASEIIRHVRIARGNGTTQGNATAGIEILAPEATPEGVLNHVRRVTVAIVDALYALPIEELEREKTKEQAISICLSYWPILEGEADRQ